jgi:hypothetical protein
MKKPPSFWGLSSNHFRMGDPKSPPLGTASFAMGGRRRSAPRGGGAVFLAHPVPRVRHHTHGPGARGGLFRAHVLKSRRGRREMTRTGPVFGPMRTLGAYMHHMCVQGAPKRLVAEYIRLVAEYISARYQRRRVFAPSNLTEAMAAVVSRRRSAVLRDRGALLRGRGAFVRHQI